MSLKRPRVRKTNILTSAQYIRTRRLSSVKVDFKQTMQAAALVSGTQTGDGSILPGCLPSTANRKTQGNGLLQ